MAEQIQLDLVNLLESKIYETQEEQYSRVKLEEAEIQPSLEEIEYEQFDGEEIFVAEDADIEETDEIVETTEEDVHFEVVVDDAKENLNSIKLDTKHSMKPKNREDFGFIIVEMDDTRAYQCDICQKTFKDKSKLRTHREIHTDERNVICPVSSTIFHLIQI